MPRARPRSRLVGCAGLTLVVACASVHGGGGALEPRFVAVHNALAAMGLAQIGPIHEGVLAQGHEARVPLDLPAGCTTIVAVGGDGLRDVDAALLDPQGKPLAHDTTSEPQAVLHACLDAADTYELVIKAASGAGSWVAATWEGGVGTGPAPRDPSLPVAQPAIGTCESPIPLTAGTVEGSTVHGETSNSGSCERSDAREMVYELDVPQRERVTIDVDARFDSVLYLRKDACTDDSAEVDCNDDAPGGGRDKSHIEHVLEPGKYFVFVDGYNQEAGAFKMTVSIEDVVSLDDACRRAPRLAAGAPASGTTEGGVDDAHASCGGGAEGADAPWRFDLTSRSRVRLVEHSDAVSPVVHVRRACVDEQSEVACSDSGAASGDATIAGVLEVGSYTAFADARERDAAGRYTLVLDVAPPEGSGATGDGCGDAMALAGPATSVSGDTFTARDDVAGSCGGAGAADVVYRLDVAKRSRLVAMFDGEEGTHLLMVWRRCGDRSSEIACGRVLEEVLPAGTYFVGVDGVSPDALGRFTLEWSLQDLGAQAGACAAAPLLVEGHALPATTAGAADKFGVSCAAGIAGASGPDRVFKLVVRRPATVRVSVESSAFDPAIALRKSCQDASGGAAASELGCEADADGSRRTSIERSVEPGTYWVVVDGATPNDQGPFTVGYRITR
jgi:hypothetical protein